MPVCVYLTTVINTTIIFNHDCFNFRYIYINIFSVSTKQHSYYLDDSL